MISSAFRLYRNLPHLPQGRIQQHRFLSSRGLSSTANDDDADGAQSLLQLHDVQLRNRKNPVHLNIQHASEGGHALLGRNASGKTLLTREIANRSDKHNHIASVSFDSHQELLNEDTSKYVSESRRQNVDKAVDFVSVHKAISGGNGGLSKAAQFLVVRFGLYSLLSRDVRTLSTGEIRKVLLIRALAQNPRLLILDNAFDGLDVPSRIILQDLVRKTLRGFGQDILVQGVSSKNTTHTQVILATHRPEEIVDEISTVSYFDDVGLTTEPRNDRLGEDLFQLIDNEMSRMDKMWDHPSLPSPDEVKDWWKQGPVKLNPETTVLADNLTIRKGEFTLLRDLNWTVERGKKWLLAGGNGAGKSTMSRLLAKPGDWSSGEEDSLGVLDDSGSSDSGSIRPGVGWVSTELHLQMAADETDEGLSVRDVIDKGEQSVGYETVARWFDMHHDHILDAPFTELSQGQQKLVMVIAALAHRPALLVLDEPCQGLDLNNRQKLLGIVERICSSVNNEMSLVYITHHLEELLPSVSHVMHLKDRRASYCGRIEDYDPSEAEAGQK